MTEEDWKILQVEAVLDGYRSDGNLTQTRTVLAIEYFRGCSRDSAERYVQGYFGNSDGTNGWCAEGEPLLNDFLIWPGLPRFARCPECLEQWQRENRIRRLEAAWEEAERENGKRGWKS